MHKFVADDVIGVGDRPPERQDDAPAQRFGDASRAFAEFSFNRVRLLEIGVRRIEHDRLAAAQFGAAYRAPMRESYLSATEDGKPAAPLMGGFCDYDGGETALGLGPFTYMLAYNDYATFFQFVPRDVEKSDIVITWLVKGTAREGIDFERDRVTWLWKVTTEQDKSIIEANAAGIRSSVHTPTFGVGDWIAHSAPFANMDRATKPGGKVAVTATFSLAFTPAATIEKNTVSS